MKTVKFIWATSLCVALGMGIISCGDENEEIEPSSNKEASGKVKGHEYVDLGLSVKWATCNVGASSPEEYGDYYAWGETKTKDVYDLNTYKWCQGSENTLTKYFTDNKTVLDPEDDVAHVKWGGSWRMPTEEEMTELCHNCTWTETTQGGKNGYKVTGPNGNSIFLPAAGVYVGSTLYNAGSYGIYWSSSLDSSYPDGAYYVGFDSSGVGRYYDGRDYGQSVRPVCP